MATSSQEKIHGIVKTLTFVNSDTGYFVAKIMVEGRGERAVIGNAPVINVGEYLTASGTWQSSKWGPQFKAADVILSAPTMLAGIESYLANAIPGIGKGYAKKMVAALGETIFDVIENSPEKLYAVEGIGPKRGKAIVAAIAEQRSVREIMVFLHKAGLSTNKAHRVYKAYGDAAIKKIKENPYILCRDLWGFGFKTADDVALKQGIPRDSEYRINAGIQHVLKKAEENGSCGVPVPVLKEEVCQLLNLPLGLIEACIANEISVSNIIKDTSNSVECIFTPRIYSAEQNIAKRLLEHARRTPVVQLEDVDGLVFSAELELGMELDETQREAVKTALLSNVCVITGGPGTGKTTITKVLLKVFNDSGLTGIVLSAPTGKAAQRAATSTGFEAATIHRTLEVTNTGQFKHNAENPLECDVWTSDEASMQDISITNSMVKALSSASRFILIGDVNQIPSVGPGKVLSDIIESEAFPTVRLTKVFRQAAKSDIIKNAYAVNEGLMPRMGYQVDSDFCFTTITPTDPQNEADKKICREEIEKEVLRVARDMYKAGYDPIKEVQILAPMRKGILGVESLNIQLQSLLNPDPDKMVEVLGVGWRTGDKVMQRRNNYEKKVFNGDVGYITDINPAEKIIMVQFDEQLVLYKFSDMDDLVLAYAMTIHKSQGSEFPVVIIPIDWSHFQMLKRNLIYTALTRAKNYCVVIGQPAAMRHAVQTAQNDERYTKLKDFLRA